MAFILANVAFIQNSFVGIHFSFQILNLGTKNQNFCFEKKKNLFQHNKQEMSDEKK